MCPLSVYHQGVELALSAGAAQASLEVVDRSGRNAGHFTKQLPAVLSKLEEDRIFQQMQQRRKNFSYLIAGRFVHYFFLQYHLSTTDLVIITLESRTLISFSDPGPGPPIDIEYISTWVLQTIRYRTFTQLPWPVQHALQRPMILSSHNTGKRSTIRADCRKVEQWGRKRDNRKSGNQCTLLHISDLGLLQSSPAKNILYCWMHIPSCG